MLSPHIKESFWKIHLANCGWLGILRRQWRGETCAEMQMRRGPSSAWLSKGENKEAEAEGRGEPRFTSIFLHSSSSACLLSPTSSVFPLCLFFYSVGLSEFFFFSREHREDAGCCGRWFGRDVFGQKGGGEPGLGGQQRNTHRTPAPKQSLSL